MILFKEDWYFYPSAIPDYKTSNKTFLELAALYKAMGVENYDFHLALMQPELSGVNPYDPFLTDEYKEKIAAEVNHNPWYFFREVVRVPPASGYDGIPLIANRANISFFWSFFNGIDYVLIQPRQTGKSVNSDALSTYMYLFAATNSKMLLITKNDDLRADNVDRLRKFRSYLPKWLVYEDKTDANNTMLVTYNLKSNKYRTAVGQNSEDAALKIGRGATVMYLHSDEGPFTNFIDVTLPAALSAMNAATDQAKANGFPCGRVFTTTAGKLNSRSGEYFYNEIVAPAVPWTEKFLDLKDNKELRKVLWANNKSFSIVGTWNHRQLGYTDEWLYQKIRESRSSGEDADRDYFNRWTTGGLSSPLPVSILTQIMESETDPAYVDIHKSGYIMNWYVEDPLKYIEQNHVSVGVDTSDAIGADNIAIVLTSQVTTEVIGTAVINESWLPSIATWLADLMVQYKKTTLIIEDKSSAQTFIDTVILKLCAAGEDPLKRIFNRIYQEPDKYPKQMELIKSIPLARRTPEWYRQFRKYFGFMTTGATREFLYSTVLMNAAKTSASMIRDRRLSKEIRELESKNGRVDHGRGKHDDIVIAWLLSNYFFFHGINLAMYGVDPTRFRVRIGKDGDVDNIVSLKARAEQDGLRDEINNLAEQLKNTSNINLMLALDSRIRALSSNLTDSDEIETIDAMLLSARKQRIKRTMENRYLRRAA